MHTFYGISERVALRRRDRPTEPTSDTFHAENNSDRLTVHLMKLGVLLTHKDDISARECQNSPTGDTFQSNVSI